MPKSCLNIMFLYLDEFWRKRIFNSKIQVLKNTDFGFRQNLYDTKMVQKSLKYVLKFFTHVCISKYYTELKFVDF